MIEIVAVYARPWETYDKQESSAPWGTLKRIGVFMGI